MKSYLSYEQIKKDGKYYFKCGKCGKLVLTSDAYYDTKDEEKKHFKCLSQQRLDEIEKEYKDGGLYQ